MYQELVSKKKKIDRANQRLKQSFSDSYYREKTCINHFWRNVSFWSSFHKTATSNLETHKINSYCSIRLYATFLLQVIFYQQIDISMLPRDFVAGVTEAFTIHVQRFPMMSNRYHECSKRRIRSICKIKFKIFFHPQIHSRIVSNASTKWNCIEATSRTALHSLVRQG